MSNLRKAAEMALEALTCSDENDDIGHRCVHCDDYVDRNGSVRDALRAALKETEQDWSMLEPAKESLREHMLEIQRLRALLGERNEKENNSSN